MCVQNYGPALTSDLVGSLLAQDSHQRLALLSTLDISKRLRMVNALLQQRLATAGLGSQTPSSSSSSTPRTRTNNTPPSPPGSKPGSPRGGASLVPREASPETDSDSDNEDAAGKQQGEPKALLAKLKAAHPPTEVLDAATREYRRLKRTNEQHPGYASSLAYLETLSELPWGRRSGGGSSEGQSVGPSLATVRYRLDADHFGLEKVKDRIVQFVAVQALRGWDARAPVLCLVGPPGVGKTSIARSMAAALQRPFQRISLGGVRDEAEIRGHRRTYIGALPGRVITALRRSGASDAVLLLDEVDKTGRDARGDPAAALLEVLDPEQNAAFVDTYLGVPVDLSRVVFVATANAAADIPPALLDRMEVVNLSGYTVEEKLGIAERHLVPKALAEHGIDAEQLAFPTGALRGLIEGHTREAGVRQLAQCLAAICRHVAVRLVAEREQARMVTGVGDAQPSGPFAGPSSGAASHFTTSSSPENNFEGSFNSPQSSGKFQSRFPLTSSFLKEERNNGTSYDGGLLLAQYFLPGDMLGVKGGFAPWISQGSYPQNIPVAPGSYDQGDTSNTTSSTLGAPPTTSGSHPRWFLTWLGRQKQSDNGAQTTPNHNAAERASNSSSSAMVRAPEGGGGAPVSRPSMLRLLGPGSMGLLTPHQPISQMNTHSANPSTTTSTTSTQISSANPPRNTGEMLSHHHQATTTTALSSLHQARGPSTTPTSVALVPDATTLPYTASTSLHLPIIVDEAMIEEVLGPKRFRGHDATQRVSSPGAAAGLVWTSAGGAVQYIECLMVGAGHGGAPGNFTLTGQLGDVLEESARIAVSWVRAHAGALGLPVGEDCPARRWDVHIHLPAGGVPKDGPSAGVTLAVALVSLFTGRCVRADTALTGELTLRGLVLPVGGVKEKVLAAVAAGMRQVILPARNLADVEAEVPAEARAGLDLIPVERLDQVLEAAFDPPFHLVSGEVGYPAARL